MAYMVTVAREGCPPIPIVAETESEFREKLIRDGMLTPKEADERIKGYRPPLQGSSFTWGPSAPVNDPFRGR